MKFKTWEYRLMWGILRRERGAGILLGASHHLTGFRERMVLQPFGHKYREVTAADKQAAELLEEIWLTDGNFYKSHRNFPAWQEKARKTWLNLTFRLCLLRDCILFRDLDHYFDN